MFAAAYTAAAIEKKLAAEQLMKEVASANSEQIRRKDQMKVRMLRVWGVSGVSGVAFVYLCSSSLI